MRVYIDASVIIASLLSPGGGSSLIFQYVKAGKLKGIISQTVIDELLEERKYKKFKKSKEDIEDFIVRSGLIIREGISLEEISLYVDLVDEEDAHLIAGAHLTNCIYLVSLDKKHLVRPDMREKFLPLRIVSPKELLEEILK